MVNSDFQRVKRLWQTRVGRSKSAGFQEYPDQEANICEERKDEYRQSIVHEDEAPQTPVVDVDSYEPTEECDMKFESSTVSEDVAPVPSPSSSSTAASINSPSASPAVPHSTSLLKPVNSLLKTFPSIKHKTSTAPAPSSAGPPTLFSFPPPIRSRWRSSRSASDATSNTSLSSSTSSFSFASNLSSALPPREAAENATNNVHNVCPRSRIGLSRSISCGSPYGELVIVDILEAKGLVIDRDESGMHLPFVATMQLGCTSQHTSPIDPSNLVVNERFVFWIASSPTIDQRTIDIFVRGGNKRELGEVHLSLAMPLNEAFGDWFPLVSRDDGHKHGSLRVAMRRVVLTSLPMVEAAKILSKHQSCLSSSDSKLYGDLLPELWNRFPGQASEVISSSPSKEKETGRKLGRLIGYHDVHRNVF